MQKFDHMVKVRNRSQGKIVLPDHLDLETTSDNLRLLTPSEDDLNMHAVIKASSCQHGKLRRMASRTLTALGYISGKSRVLTDAEGIKSMHEQLKFAASVETVKRSEKKRRESAAIEAKKKRILAAQKKEERLKAKNLKYEKIIMNMTSKLGIGVNDDIGKDVVMRLTGYEIDAYAWVRCGHKVIKGTVTVRREKLINMLGLSMS